MAAGAGVALAVSVLTGSAFASLLSFLTPASVEVVPFVSALLAPLISRTNKGPNTSPALEDEIRAGADQPVRCGLAALGADLNRGLGDALNLLPFVAAALHPYS